MPNLIKIRCYEINHQRRVWVQNILWSAKGQEAHSNHHSIIMQISHFTNLDPWDHQDCFRLQAARSQSQWWATITKIWPLCISMSNQAQANTTHLHILITTTNKITISVGWRRIHNLILQLKTLCPGLLLKNIILNNWD